jgi:hypothetical protein
MPRAEAPVTVLTDELKIRRLDVGLRDRAAAEHTFLHHWHVLTLDSVSLERAHGERFLCDQRYALAALSDVW